MNLLSSGDPDLELTGLAFIRRVSILFYAVKRYNL